MLPVLCRQTLHCGNPLELGKTKRLLLQLLSVTPLLANEPLPYNAMQYSDPLLGGAGVGLIRGSPCMLRKHEAEALAAHTFSQRLQPCFFKMSVRDDGIKFCGVGGQQR